MKRINLSDIEAHVREGPDGDQRIALESTRLAISVESPPLSPVRLAFVLDELQRLIGDRRAGRQYAAQAFPAEFGDGFSPRLCARTLLDTFERRYSERIAERSDRPRTR
jgi:hypothetical protein